MKSWITMLLAATVLCGCVTTREVVYREPYRGEGYVDGYYDDGQTYYRDGDSRYVPAGAGTGDYYYGTSWSSGYIDTPYYYSMFWPINRWYYDPFVYPGYYYGVTWFPQNYFGFGLSWNRPWGGVSLSYSPYRYAWVDNYYDWRPWYSSYPQYRQYYPAPRYGDARVEAQRLADLRRPPLHPSQGRPHYGQGMPVQTSRSQQPPSYRGNRMADYGAVGPRTASRPTGSFPATQDVRRVGAGEPRVEPRTGAFGNPVRAPRPAAAPSNGWRGTVPAAPADGARREIQRIPRASQPVTTPRPLSGGDLRERQVQDSRGYDMPVQRRSNVPVRSSTSPQPSARSAPPGVQQPMQSTVARPVMRESTSPREAVSERNFSRPVNRGYSSQVPVREAPVTSYPRGNTAPPVSREISPRSTAPRASSPEPVSATRQDAPPQRSSSASSDQDGVRRVGSSRGR